MESKKVIRRVGTSVFTEEGHGVEVKGQMFKCPNCTTPGCKGSVSKGTVLEIQCRRCNTKYILSGN
jgi:hypothetical protein